MAYADYWGEKLAWFFGITSPKYYWELEEFKRMEAEEEERKKKEAEETFGWAEKGEEKQVINVELFTNGAVKMPDPGSFAYF